MFCHRICMLAVIRRTRSLSHAACCIGRTGNSGQHRKYCKDVRRDRQCYWHLVDVRVYEDLDDFFSKNQPVCMRLFSTKAPRRYDEADYPDGSYLFFGKETKGLPETFLAEHYDACVRIPIRAEARSLNLSNSVAVGVFEALRQQSFPHLQEQGRMITWNR